MKKVFEGAITFKVDKGHPDMQYIKNPNEPLSFNDTYTMDTDYYSNEEEMIGFIKHDLSIVAGGGYSKEHISNVSFNIKRIK